MVAFTTLLIALLTGRTSGFVPLRPWIVEPTSRSALAAKKSRKNPSKKGSQPSAGGFGAPKAGPAPVDDYAAFPRLEPDVLETLVPASDSQISNEIYQRLDQIYGLESFNYESREEEQLSFTDLLSSSASSTPSNSLGDLIAGGSPPPTTSLGASEFDDLLKSATGGSASTTAASQKPSPAPVDLPLGQLPPFSDIRVLHIDPLVLAVDNFFTSDECDRYVAMSSKKKNKVTESRSPTVGKDTAAKSQRTSTTWYHHFSNVPELMAKASRLLGLDTIHRWEEPQTVRYRRNEKFTWHLDALGPSENLPNMGGQRIATLLVYLTDLTEQDGGATIFRDLGQSEGQALRVQPQKGMALLFFPAAGGIPNTPFDIRTLHCGEVVADEATNDKYIAQLWLRERTYTPTAPPGNDHAKATEAISDYCAVNESLKKNL